MGRFGSADLASNRTVHQMRDNHLSANTEKRPKPDDARLVAGIPAPAFMS